MFFASVDLASRIERAERQLITDSAEAVKTRRPETDVFVLPISGGAAVFTGHNSPLNKVVGLGFDGPIDEARLAEVEQAYAEREAPVQVEISTLGDPSIAALLTRRGYVLMGFENVLGRRLPLESLSAPVEGIEITSTEIDEFATWLDIVVTGFANPDTQGVPSSESFPREILEQIIGDMASAEGFRLYMAHREGTPAGGASMRIHEGIAQLCGAATLPDHRRNGVQSTLLNERLAIASRKGCEVAVVTTQPGSKSCENVQRKGFELLFPRAVLVRSPEK